MAELDSVETWTSSSTLGRSIGNQTKGTRFGSSWVRSPTSLFHLPKTLQSSLPNFNQSVVEPAFLFVLECVTFCAAVLGTVELILL